jgi:hypothetical protein
VFSTRSQFRDFVRSALSMALLYVRYTEGDDNTSERSIDSSKRIADFKPCNSLACYCVMLR